MSDPGNWVAVELDVLSRFTVPNENDSAVLVRLAETVTGTEPVTGLDRQRAVRAEVQAGLLSVPSRKA